MIDHLTLEKIAGVVSSSAKMDHALTVELKSLWPSLRFTLCNDDDMPARMPPALRCETFNLYLVGGGEHCIGLTTDIDQAIGVVIAAVDDQ